MTVADVRRKTAERMSDRPADIACGYCGAATTRETLSALGARCRPCFEQYQRQGYSGAQPARQARQCPEVRADQAKIAAYMADRTAPPSVFADLSAALHKRLEDRRITGLDDDSVNALLQAEA